MTMALNHLLLVSLSLAVASAQWVRHGNSYYTLSEDTGSYQTGEEFCESHGAHLIDISDADEQAFAQGLLGSSGINAYIGLNDIVGEGNFVWSDGSTPSYANYEPGQPNDSGDCFVMRQTFYNWNDVPCGQNYLAMCEADVGPWTRLEKSSYTLSDNTGSYQTMKTYCEIIGGHLIDIIDADEQAFAEGLLGSSDLNAYIGLNDIDGEGNFVWSDGSTPSYANYEPGQPNDSGDCFVMRQTYYNWNDVPCGETYRAMCEVEWCLDGWMEWQGSCYKMIGDADGLANNWEEIRDACVAAGPVQQTGLQSEPERLAYLADVSSDEENQFIARNVSGGSRAWIGAIRNSDGEFDWDVGTSGDSPPVEYANWKTNEPSNHDGVEDCVEINRGSEEGQWNDLPCKRKRFGVCKYTYEAFLG